MAKDCCDGKTLRAEPKKFLRNRAMARAFPPNLDEPALRPTVRSMSRYTERLNLPHAVLSQREGRDFYLVTRPEIGAWFKVARNVEGEGPG